MTLQSTLAVREKSRKLREKIEATTETDEQREAKERSARLAKFSHWTPTPKQVSALHVLRDWETRRVLLDGGKRSGKSEVIAHWMYARAWRYPGSWQIILRQFATHIRGTLWAKTFLPYLDKHAGNCGWTCTPLNDEMKLRFANGSTIEFEGCDDEKRVRKIFGGEYLTIWFNEASEFDWGTCRMLMTQAVQNIRHPDRDVSVPCKVLYDTNPARTGKKHWLYKVGVQNVDPEEGHALPDAGRWGRVGGWTPYDNAQHLSDMALADYESAVGVTKRQMLYGEWCTNEGLIYNEFDVEEHTAGGGEVFGERGQFLGKCVVRAIDFGYRDPFVCLWAALLHDGDVVVFKERYVRHKIVRDHADRIKFETKDLPVWWTVADHDAEDSETLRREGIFTRRARKDRPIKAGIDRVKRRFSDGTLRITKECKALRAELESYVWDEDGDAPKTKQNDHACDALRYLIAELDGGGGSMLVGI